MEAVRTVIILKIAFLSAHTPNVHAVSTHTPTYIFPDTDSTAAETPPASMILESSYLHFSKQAFEPFYI